MTQITPESPKLVDFSKATDAQLQHDPLLRKLKSWDTNSDGRFSTEEILKAASELMVSEVSEKAAQDSARRMGFLTLSFGVLLLVSLAATFVCTLLALQVAKESKVPHTTGVMLTNPSVEGHIRPVGTTHMKEQRQGLSGLKEASKEDLDRLNELSFFHDGGYHRIKVSRIDRFDGRVEVWGCPFGFLVVEDTGEVHYSMYGTPSAETAKCWGPAATLNSSDVCGEGVDNEPPLFLEVEDPVLQDPENSPTPSPEAGTLPPAKGRRLVSIGTDQTGKEIFHEVGEVETEHSEHARRLSSRRRSGGSSRRRSGGSFTSSSRRRSGGSLIKLGLTMSSRRRSYGATYSSVGSSVYVDSRRRSSSSSASLIILSGLDGSSRRRDVDYYGGTLDFRRRSATLEDGSVARDPINITIDDDADIAVQAEEAIRLSKEVLLDAAQGPDSPPDFTCPSDFTVMCDKNTGSCSCMKNSRFLGLAIGIPVGVFVLAGSAFLLLTFCPCRKR